MTATFTVLLAAMAKCRRAELHITGPTKALIGNTKIWGPDGVTYKPYSIPAREAAARVKLAAENFVSVNFRQRDGETIEGLIQRSLAELARREVSGMPKPKPAERLRRQQRKLLHQADPRRTM